jgi:hypothetical protein
MGTFQYDSEILIENHPTLVIHGSQILFFTRIAEKTLLILSRIEFILIDGMGHSIPEELFDFITEKIIQNTENKNSLFHRSHCCIFKYTKLLALVLLQTPMQNFRNILGIIHTSVMRTFK